MKADDILWNFDRHLNEQSPHFDRAQALTYRPYTSQVKHYEKIDDTHVALYTDAPFSMLPYLLSRVFIVSPTQYAKIGNWLDFQKAPAGTGPFKVVRVSPHVSIELARNEDYWDRARVPKVDKLVLMPIADFEHAGRGVALGAGGLDRVSRARCGADAARGWVPDRDQALSRISGPGMRTIPITRALHDKRVRLALNYGLDRAGLVYLLAGTAIPARGPWPDTYKYFGNPKEHYTYDPAKARALAGRGRVWPTKPAASESADPDGGFRQHGAAADGRVRATEL